MNKMIDSGIIDVAMKAAITAGHEIMRIYKHENFEVEFKSDNSPLTKADKASHQIICELLKPLGIPILSEEGKHMDYSERKDWESYWLVDPIDGTKEFIKRNGEFTVNIALIRNNKPVAGVIYVPVLETLYVGVEKLGAYKISTSNCDLTINQLKKEGQILPLNEQLDEFCVVGSRTFMTPETESFIANLKESYPKLNFVSKGSSLKICLVAEGLADIYPRFGPTMEWDTAAGHAIVKASGKNIYLTDQKTEMSYNKQNLLNPFFIVE